jgi:hypothetical protein
MPFHLAKASPRIKINLDTSSHPAKVLTLADFSSEALIISQLQSRDMTGIIQELSETFQRNDSRWNARRK